MTLYEVLGIERGATLPEIKAAYLKKRSTTHPDKGGRKEEFDEVQRAFMVLSDPERRQRYDEGGEHADQDEAALVALFETIVDASPDVDNFDLIERAVDTVVDTELGAVKQKKKIELQIRRYKIAEKRIRRKDKKEHNPLRAAMTRKVAQCEAQLLQIDVGIAACKRLLKALECYTYKYDATGGTHQPGTSSDEDLLKEFAKLYRVASGKPSR